MSPVKNGGITVAFANAVDHSILNIEKRIPSFHEEIRQHMKDIKLLCLTELNNNILLWSHYSEQHAGVVLELRCVPEQDSPWGMAAPVEYTKKMPVLLDDEAFAALVSGQRGLDHRALTRRMVFTKALDWSYEKEWRVFAGKGRTLDVYEDIPFSVQELDAVYLGCRVPDKDARDIISIVRQKYSHARLFNARKADRTFDLVFTVID